MRVVVLLVCLLLSGVAVAQDGLVSLMCQAKPTKACVLDMAAEAAFAAKAAEPDNDNLPFARIVETASQAGHLELALKLTSELRDHDGLAVAAMAEAFARKKRLKELLPLLESRGETDMKYAFVVAPAYVELEREADLAALVERLDPKPQPEEVGAWHVEGHLRAGRRGKALELLLALTDRERDLVVHIAGQSLVYGDRPALAYPLVQFMRGEDSYQIGIRSQIAEAVRDQQLARSLLAPLSRLSEEDREFATQDVIAALAASGAWKEAVELSKTLKPTDQGFALSRIAELSRQLEVFGLIEKVMASQTEEARAAMARFLVRALIVCGFAPVAQPYIDQAPVGYARNNLLTSAASALSEIGRGTDAVAIARSIENPRMKAWAIWEVAWKLKD